MRRCFVLSWLSLVVAACAASPVVDLWVDPAAVEPEPEPEDVDGMEEPDGEPEDEPDDSASQGAASSTASSTSPLASADAGGSTTSDAGARNDAAGAAAKDAGRDAAATRPSLLPTLPGGLDLGNLSPPRTRACMASKDCTVSCFPVGFVSCCRADHICGCSWAPGAYCL
jgi:hypothetical protein